MGESSEISGKLGDANVIELTGKIMVVAIIILFCVVIFVFCLHLYAKWFWYRHRRQENPTSRRRGQDITTVLVSALSHGLDPSVLKTLPVVIFDPNEFKDGLECAVCLCEVSKGEKARLLPKCNHGFHLDCIDMWFQSHSTCPLCREDHFILENIIEAPMAMVENPSLPTNVLFWGDESQVSTFGPCTLDHEENQNSASSEPSSSSWSSSMVSTSNNRPAGGGMLVIDIPRQINDLEEEEEEKSPIPARLRSLKRLLSGNNRRANPRNLELEQGNR